MERRVIDVSKHQGAIDWAKVKGQVDGVIIRCGYGKDIVSQDDARFKENVDACIQYGIPFGVYLYSYAKTVEDAKSEAEHVLRLVEPYKGKLLYPVYLDLEESGTESGAVERALVFGDLLETAGFWCGVYANQYWWTSYLKDGLNRFTKWVAKYGTNNGQPQTEPSVENTDMWQYTSVGVVDGIKGNVDMNICYRDFPAEIKGITFPARKSNEEIAAEVLAGKWGNGAERKSRLTSAGYNYEAVQKIVNARCGKKTLSTKKSNEEIAKEVVRGKWGNGAERKNNLIAAGYDYTTIQNLVNKMLP